MAGRALVLPVVLVWFCVRVAVALAAPELHLRHVVMDDPMLTVVAGVEQDSAPVDGLTPEQFAVSLTGARIELVSAAPLGEADERFGTVVVVDTSDGARSAVPRMRDAVTAWIAARAPREEMMVVAFDDGTRNADAPFTADPEAIRAQLAAVDGGGGPAFLYSALDRVVQAVADREGRPGIVSVVVLTPGRDAGSPGPPEAAYAIATQRGIPVHILIVGQARGAGTMSLRDLAAASSGSFREAAPGSLPSQMHALQRQVAGMWAVRARVGKAFGGDKPFRLTVALDPPLVYNRKLVLPDDWAGAKLEPVKARPKPVEGSWSYSVGVLIAGVGLLGLFSAGVAVFAARQMFARKEEELAKRRRSELLRKRREEMRRHQDAMDGGTPGRSFEHLRSFELEPMDEDLSNPTDPTPIDVPVEDAARFRLLILNGPQAGLAVNLFEVDAARCVLGTDPIRCDVLIEHPSISSLHVRFTRADGVTFVEDLGSTNGTFVEGQDLRDNGAPSPLFPGQTLQVGDVQLMVGESRL